MGRIRMLGSRLTPCATSAIKEQPTISWNGAKSSSALYGHRWRKERAQFLLHNPLCVHCKDEKLVYPANEVDHIIPHRGNMELFWDQNNWQALCKRHHSIKTSKFDRLPS